MKFILHKLIKKKLIRVVFSDKNVNIGMNFKGNTTLYKNALRYRTFFKGKLMKMNLNLIFQRLIASKIKNI